MNHKMTTKLKTHSSVDGVTADAMNNLAACMEVMNPNQPTLLTLISTTFNLHHYLCHAVILTTILTLQTTPIPTRSSMTYITTFTTVSQLPGVGQHGRSQTLVRRVLAATHCGVWREVHQSGGIQAKSRNNTGLAG